jgi:uracil phosphoribosyltransferase
MRDAATKARDFVASARVVSMCLLLEATKWTRTASTIIKTPLSETACMTMAPTKVCIASILRAGLVMSGTAEEIIINTVTYHIWLQRSTKTHEPTYYCDNLPDSFADSGITEIFICDPILATGGSACMAIKMCLARGIAEEDIKVLCILSCTEGLRTVFKTYPSVSIITACVDEKLDDNARIIPGLGDAGDRIFGTYTPHVRPASKTPIL